MNEPMSEMTDGDIVAAQHGVQRLLGRCLLRLQQYEKLMKLLVAHHELAGAAHDLQRIQENRVKATALDSLGILVGKLTGSYLVDEPNEQPIGDERDMPADALSIGFRMQIQMTPEDYVRTKASLKELVDLRNRLVHHFIDQFNVWSLEGCAAASVHLQTSYERIDRHFEQLRSWAEQMEEAKKLHVAFLQSPEFENFIIHGIAPDGLVHWPVSGIVRVLREAARHLACDGWTRLDAATVWIGERHAEQCPSKYGCRTWRQVIHESRLFDLQRRVDETGHRVAWFRERPVSLT